MIVCGFREFTEWRLITGSLSNTEHSIHYLTEKHTKNLSYTTSLQHNCQTELNWFTVVCPRLTSLWNPSLLCYEQFYGSCASWFFSALTSFFKWETWTTLSPCGSSFSSSYWIPLTSSWSAGPMRKESLNCCRQRRWPGCGEPARTSPTWTMTNSAGLSDTTTTR